MLRLSRVARLCVPVRTFHSDVKYYNDLHKRSIDPKTREQFWGEQANKLDWFKQYDSVLKLDPDTGYGQWFLGGETNICHNAVDRHVKQGRGNQTALIWDSVVTGEKRHYSYSELQDNVSRVAGALAQLGVKKGDHVLLYMPMIPEAVFAMLATVRLGAAHSVVFGGFAGRELAVRIDDCKPTMVIAANMGVEPGKLVNYTSLLNHALELAKWKPPVLLLKHRSGNASDTKLPLSPSDHDLKSVIPDVAKDTTKLVSWDDVVPNAKPHPCVPVGGDHTSYVLYTSGTTGTPKGIVRDTGGSQTTLHFVMEEFMKVNAGDRYFCASDIGWVVGHSFIVYGPLLRGCATVLFEGKPIYPNAGVFWRIAEEHKINALYTAPTALRAIRKLDPQLELTKQYDLSQLRAVFLAGERADPETVRFFSSNLQKPIVDNFWQTETGSPVIGWHDTTVGVKPGSASKPLAGYDCQILHMETSSECAVDELGELCMKLPLPPGTLVTVLNNPKRFHSAYLAAHPGYFSTGDFSKKDADGYISIMSRKDDLINCAGHRLSTATLEQAISKHPSIAECACIGAADPLKGEVPVAFLILKAGTTAPPAEVEKQVVQLVREEVGPVASFRSAFVVEMLPKTRSGKILRGVMRAMANQESFTTPATIEDARALTVIQSVIDERWISTKFP